MKYYKSLLLTLLCTLAACAPHHSGGSGHLGAIVGGEKGNGAETVNDLNNSAWFTNPNNYVPVCMVVDPKFGASREFAKQALDEASRAWLDYIGAKHINAPVSRIDFWTDGDCRQGDGLTVYFGSSNSEIDAAAKKYTNPVAFAHRQSQDLQKGTSKGFIWIARQGSLDGGGAIYPDWSQKYNLTGILMHELGHVYGIDHVPLTIMDSRIADFLKENEGTRKDRLGGIDSYRDLYICVGCPILRPGYLGFSEKEDPAGGLHSATSNFHLLTGRSPTGPVTARVEGAFTDSIALQVDDFESTEVFKIELDPASGGLPSQGETEGIFRVAKINDQGVVVVSAIRRGSRVLYGRVKTRTGSMLPVVIELNLSTQVGLKPSPMSVDGLVIKTFKEGIPNILFFTIAY